MSARPHWLRGYMPRDFGPTEGRTQPAVTVPGVHVLPADEWLSDDELARLTAEEREEARRAEIRARCDEVREEMRISRREWAIWAAFFVAGLCAFAWLPDAGYGWHLAALSLLAP